MFGDDNPYELLYMYRQNDEHAYHYLIEMFMPMLRGSVRGMMDRYGDAIAGYEEDLMQEVIIAFDSAVESYRGDKETSFFTYTRLLLERRLNKVIDHVVFRNARAIDRVPVDNVADFAAEIGLMNPEYSTRFFLARDAAEQARQHLPAIQKEALELYISGCSHQEAADRLGISLRAYRYRLGKARRCIRDAVMK